MTTRRTTGGRRRHWLCIAQSFPPVNRSGTHRTAAFVRHFHALGWDATVLTSRPVDEPLDEASCAGVPSSTAVIEAPCRLPIVAAKSLLSLFGRSEAAGSAGASASTDGGVHGRRRVRDWFSHWLVTPDARIGWVLPAVRAGLAAIRRRRPEVIYATAPCFSAHLVGAVLSRLSGRPFIADFRDPWRDNPFRVIPYGVIDGWDSFLERFVVRRAARVVCNTPAMTDRLCRRYPEVSGKASTILNGFDPERFVGLASRRPVGGERFVLTHAGQFYGRRSPRVLFRAIREAVAMRPELADRLHVALVGRETCDGRSLRVWARDEGVSEWVGVVGQVTHGEALAYLAGSDALLLAGVEGSGSALQVPNKLFEYLAVKRPILATCSADSPIRGIMASARAEAVVCDAGDAAALARGLLRIATARRRPVAGRDRYLDRFARVHRARELEALFRLVTRRGTGGASVLVRASSLAAGDVTAPALSVDAFEGVDYASARATRTYEACSSRPAARHRRFR